MTAIILGTEYEITEKKYAEDESFAKLDCTGYCDGLLKKIVVCDMMTYPDYAYSEEEAIVDKKRIIRHEIVHAFLNESGLESSSNKADAWAQNEEMVDWFALQGLKIYKVWQEVGAI